jgi:hypothetical protein
MPDRTPAFRGDPILGVASMRHNLRPVRSLGEPRAKPCRRVLAEWQSAHEGGGRNEWAPQVSARVPHAPRDSRWQAETAQRGGPAGWSD